MTDRKTETANRRKAARKCASIARRLEALSEEARQVAELAPGWSYLANEARKQVFASAQRMQAVSERIEAFESFDAEDRELMAQSPRNLAIERREKLEELSAAGDVHAQNGLDYLNMVKA